MDTEMTRYESFAEVTEDFYCSAVDVLKILVLRLHDYLRREDYLPLGATVHMEGRAFRVDNVNFDKDSVTLQDVALAEMRMPIFREAPLAVVRELYEQEQDEPKLSDGELDALPISAVVDGEVQTFPDAAALDEALNAEPVPEAAGLSGVCPPAFCAASASCAAFSAAS